MDKPIHPAVEQRRRITLIISAAFLLLSTLLLLSPSVTKKPFFAAAFLLPAIANAISLYSYDFIRSSLADSRSAQSIPPLILSSPTVVLTDVAGASPTVWMLTSLVFVICGSLFQLGLGLGLGLATTLYLPNLYTLAFVNLAVANARYSGTEMSAVFWVMVLAPVLLTCVFMWVYWVYGETMWLQVEAAEVKVKIEVV